MAVSLSSKNNAKEEQNEIEFKTFTSAVCSNSGDFVKCKDELFVSCNGKISRADEINECSGIKIGNPITSGFTVFEKEWRDPGI